MPARKQQQQQQQNRKHLPTHTVIWINRGACKETGGNNNKHQLIIGHSVTRTMQMCVFCVSLLIRSGPSGAHSAACVREAREVRPHARALAHSYTRMHTQNVVSANLCDVTASRRHLAWTPLRVVSVFQCACFQTFNWHFWDRLVAL